MLDLGESYPPTWAGRPAGMLDQDVPVWLRFLKQEGATFDRFYYNARITTENLPARFTDPLALTIAQKLIPKRIDALAERPGELWIIEVAETIGLRAIGQVLTYAELWRAEHPAEKRRIQPTRVGAAIGADEQLSARAAGITVIRV